MIAIPGYQFRRKSLTPVLHRHYAASVERRRRVLDIATWMSAALGGFWVIVQLAEQRGPWQFIAAVNGVSALIFAMVPLLHRFGELIAPVVFLTTGSMSVVVLCFTIGAHSGLLFYSLVAASLVFLVLGIEHMIFAAALAVIGATLTVVVEFIVPGNTGRLPVSEVHACFVVSVTVGTLMVIATVCYALLEISHAEAVAEAEYERSESLLDNILPASIAARLKDPSHGVIADKYDEASILFADIAGYTQLANDIEAEELVRFLDALYTAFDYLVDQHGLEKVKTSGDACMVVSGVPQPRPDHAEALAGLALDMAAAMKNVTDPKGRPVPLRIGLAAGAVVAGVVGARRFFYDVWGDAVNVAQRMESTGADGRIQVPDAFYERLKDAFVFEERGYVDVKGKGTMHTWYLVGRRSVEVSSTTPGNSSDSTAAGSLQHCAR